MSEIKSKIVQSIKLFLKDDLWINFFYLKTTFIANNRLNIMDVTLCNIFLFYAESRLIVLQFFAIRIIYIAKKSGKQIKSIAKKWFHKKILIVLLVMHIKCPDRNFFDRS